MPFRESPRPAREPETRNERDRPPLVRTLTWAAVAVLALSMGVAELYAQNGDRRGGEGVVSGRVVEAKSGGGIEYANVALLSIRDSSVITGAVTDSTGRFAIDRVPPGTYLLRVSYLGYAPRFVRNVRVTQENRRITMPDVRLSPGMVELGEVDVTSQREAAVFSLDKKIFNVDRNIATAGGTALDAMQNIPSVSVDADGVVSLRGSANVNIFVDGRPNGLAGVSGSDVLNQIPASSIDRIEVVTNPSVRYDPEGTSGIINIVMKKKSNDGFHAITSLNAAYQDRYNGSVNMNFRSDVWNVFASYDNRFNTYGRTNDAVRTTTVGGTASVLDQSEVERNRYAMHNVNVGTDFRPDERNMITLSYRYRPFDRHGSTYGDDLGFDAENLPVTRTLRDVGEKRDVVSTEFTASYKGTFVPDREELTADATYSRHAMDLDDLTAQDFFDLAVDPATPVSTLRRSISHNTNRMWTAQADYSLAIGDASRFAAGFKSSGMSMDMRYAYDNWDAGRSVWTSDSALASDFLYDELIHAAYGMWTGRIAAMKYQVGLRAEWVRTDPRTAGGPSSSRNTYTSLYPSVHLAYPLNESNELQLSYSRRVDRPRNRELNPYVDASDSLNLRSGNPFLRPEYIDSYECGHAYLSGATSLTSAIFLRHTHDLIERISTLEPNGATRTVPQNVSSATDVGVEFTAARPLTEWWRANLSASYFRTDIAGSESGLGLNSSQTSWDAKFNTTVTAWWNVQFQLMANYEGPSATPQGSEDANYTVDIALRKDFFRGDLSTTLRVSDVFNSRKYGSRTAAADFSVVRNRKYDSRAAYVGITFRINSDAKQKDREQDRSPEGEGDF